MSKNGRILFIAHDAEKSGAPRVTTRLAIALHRRGRGVLLCFPGRGGCEEEARAAGVPVAVIDNPPVSLAGASSRHRLRLLGKRLAAFFNYWRLARRRDVDLVWVGSSVGIVAGTAAWLAGKPVIYHVHEDLVLSRATRAKVFLIRHTARGLIFVARKCQAAFEPRPRGQRWRLIPNSIDAGAFEAAPRDEGLRKEQGAGDGDVVYLTLAYLSPRKGIDVLLRAFERLSRNHGNMRLWIAGDTRPEHRAFVEDQHRFIREAGLEDRVRFLGHREDVARLLKSADVLVLSSRNEALPLTIAEAMAAGRPVVATDVGSVRDMVAEGRTGHIVPPEDEEALAKGMAVYADDPKLRKRHGRAGRKLCLKRYAAEPILEQVEKLADRVMR